MCGDHVDFEDLIAERYSVRDYSDKNVEEEKLKAVLNAGRLAPTAKNIQPQMIYVLKSKESIEKIRGLSKMAFNAPIVMLICADTNQAFQSPFCDRNFGDTDAAIVTCHMMLQAAELGLGTCWVGYFDPKEICEAFDIPKNMTLFNILPLGYASDKCEPSPRHFERKDLKETVKEL